MNTHIFRTDENYSTASTLVNLHPKEERIGRVMFINIFLIHLVVLHQETLFVQKLSMESEYKIQAGKDSLFLNLIFKKCQNSFSKAVLNVQYSI